MIITRFFWFLKCIILKAYYKVCFRNRIKIGKNVKFRSMFKIFVEPNGNINIGNNVFFNNYCSINCHKSISIGDNSLFGESVKIYDHNHKFSLGNLISNQDFSCGSISIGSNCWICSNVIILKNVSIGNNCVISAGAVIDFSVPDNSIVKRVKGKYVVEEIRTK